jgi:SAM-dependent methyltransferase
VSELEQAIDPWLHHMTWRRDFGAWRERRINQELYQSERLALLEQLGGPVAGRRLLDLGAGMGGFAVAAARAGAEVVAGEYNPAYCRIIALRAARYDLHVPICNLAGESLPFQDADFDALISWDVIEHVRSPAAMLGEMQRVLRPGGHALVTVINRWAWNDPHYHIAGLNYLPRPIAERLITLRGRSKAGAAFRDMQRLSAMHYFSYAEFQHLARYHGFAVRDMREELLHAGQLRSPKHSRRVARRMLRAMGLEAMAYRLQRRFLVGMFELGMRKIDG